MYVCTVPIVVSMVNFTAFDTNDTVDDDECSFEDLDEAEAANGQVKNTCISHYELSTYYNSKHKSCPLSLVSLEFCNTFSSSRIFLLWIHSVSSSRWSSIRKVWC